MVQAKYYDIQSVFDAQYQSGVFGKVSHHLVKLHELAKSFERPIIMECGVKEGWSTGIFAHACELVDGQLISVDIDDCSDAIISDRWQFIQRDDTDQDYIFAQAPILRSGIDIIYIDSLHSGAHVSKVINLYYPYVNQGDTSHLTILTPGLICEDGEKIIHSVRLAGVRSAIQCRISSMPMRMIFCSNFILGARVSAL